MFEISLRWQSSQARTATRNGRYFTRFTRRANAKPCSESSSQAWQELQVTYEVLRGSRPIFGRTAEAIEEDNKNLRIADSRWYCPVYSQANGFGGL